MPSYTVLGATGRIGSTVVQALLDKPDTTVRRMDRRARLANDAQIHCFVRSRDKLIARFPGIAERGDVKIFIGAIGDVEQLVDCVAGTRAVIVCTAPPGNQPGTSLAVDTARDLIAACQQLKAAGRAVPRRILVLSSVSTEHRLDPDTPKFVQAIVYRAFSHLYDDLKRAETLLREQADTLGGATVSYIKPSLVSLNVDTRTGHELDVDHARAPVAVIDLAEGMIAVADDESERYAGRSVAVNSRGAVGFPTEAPLAIVRGLISHFLPVLYSYVG